MSTRTITKVVRLPHPPATVWAFLLTESHWQAWWYDRSVLTQVDPGWEVGATMHFGTEWAPTIKELVAPSTLAFGGHRLDLADAGSRETVFRWTNSRPSTAADAFDPMFEVEEEVDQDLAAAMDLALYELVDALAGFQPGSKEPMASQEEKPAVLEGSKALDAAPAEVQGAQPIEPTSREIRVFVSSTFKDLNAERDALSKRAFIELRRLCEERGVAWTDVDLRWGITDEQKAEGKVLPICLEEIDDCRPYFIGILGERYGWVPEDLPRDHMDIAPWLTADRGRSVTELEILHGVLNEPEMASHAFFYFRDPAYIERLPPDERPNHVEGPTADEIHRYGQRIAEERASERRRRLASLKNRIESSGLTVRRFGSPEELATLVATDLKGVLDQRFPAELAPDKRKASALLHEAFIREARRTFVPRPFLNQRLDEHVQGDGGAMVVTGEAGSGKSALLANWIHEYRVQAPGEPVIPHFVGAEVGGSAWDSMLERLLGELSLVAGQEFEVPEEPNALRQAFARALHAAAAKQRFVLVIDGLNELEDREQALDLSWVPPTIPEGASVVVSTHPGRPLDEAARRGWAVLEVKALETEDRIRLIHDYLARYRKSLSDAHLRRILESDPGGNPLYLRTVLEELRLHGDHSTLGQVIDHYTEAPDLPSLFDRVLIRLEGDYERDRPGLVRDAFTLLSGARRGLTEDEILDLLGSGGERLPRALWSPFRVATGHLVSNRSGFLTPRHEQMKHAVAARYLAPEHGRATVHRRLASYFREREGGPRRTDELPWQLARAGEWTEMADLLGDMAFLAVAWKASEFDVRRYWTQIEQESSRRVIDQYRKVIEEPKAGPGSWGLITLLGSMGHFAEAQKVQESIGEGAQRAGDRANTVAALGNLAHYLQAQGHWDDALRCFREQELLAREMGHDAGLAQALGGLAGVKRVTGALADAFRLYQEEEALRLKMGDRVGIQFCLGNQALVLLEQDDPVGALRLRREQERIAREVGEIDGLRMAIEAQSVIHRLNGELEPALGMNREAEKICRDLGDRGGLATNLINQGAILAQMKEPSRAFDCYREAEILCRAMGVKQDLATVLNNLAVILYEWNHFDEAEARWIESAEVSRSLGYAMGLQGALGNLARIASLDLERGRALELLKEREAICREAGYARELHDCLMHRGEIFLCLGRSDEAQSAWAEARELADRNGLGPG